MSSRGSNSNFLEGIGTISSIFARCGTVKISEETKEIFEGLETLDFDPWTITYAGMELQTHDLTDLFLPGDTVAFTANKALKNQTNLLYRGGFGFVFVGENKNQPSEGSETEKMRIVDIGRLLENEHLPSSMIKEEFAIVSSLWENGGKIRTEKWGFIDFDFNAVAVSTKEDASRPVEIAFRLGQKVKLKLYAPPPRHDKWIILSIKAEGELKRGVAVIREVRHNLAFVDIHGAGPCFVPYSAVKVPNGFINKKRWALEKFLELREELDIEYGEDLPGHQNQYRAITLWIPSKLFREMAPTPKYQSPW